jgi:hypothetical protein
MSRARTLLAGGLGAALVATAVPALASEPSSGTVSASAPTIAWKGNAPGYGVVPTNLLVTAAGEDPVCPPQTCDTFDLTVADTADLVVSAQESGHNNFTELHVVQPDGTVQYIQSEDGKPSVVKVKKAAKGDYGIEVITNQSPDEGGAYDASATLNVPKPAAAPESTPPAATPPPAAAPAPQPAASLSLRTKKVSARTTKKALKLGVAASKPVRGLVVQLSKGKKVVGKGKLATLASKGTVKLKVSKLKAGTYVVAMVAKDASTGQTVGLRTKLKVTK